MSGRQRGWGTFLVEGITGERLQWISREELNFSEEGIGVGFPALAVFAIEEVAHGLTAGFVGFFCGLAFVGVHAIFCGGVVCFGFAALGTAVGKAGFVGFELELLFADSADFDGKRHFSSTTIKSWLGGGTKCMI
jgi:hypothetical protein